MLLAVITPFLVFSAFLLLLLVTLSVPIINTIYLLRLTAYVGTTFLDASASAVARFGAWGYCIPSINVSILGLSDTTNPQLCSHPRLGYDFDSTVQAALRVDNVDPNALSRTITAVLVLHPIACGITFLSLLLSLLIFRWRAKGVSRPAAYLTLGLGLLSAVLTTVVFLFDVIFVAVARQRIKNDTQGAVTGTWGNGVWMVLGATVALWIALVSAVMALFKAREVYKYKGSAESVY